MATPTFPTAFEVTLIAPQAVAIAWSYPESGEVDGYRVLRSIDGGVNYTLVQNVDEATFAVTDVDVLLGVTYTYIVRAFNATDGDGAPTDPQSVVTPAPGFPVDPPEPSPGDPALVVVAYRTLHGLRAAQLGWYGFFAASMDIYRQGELLATTGNQTPWIDAIGGRAPGTFTYYVCEAGTEVCAPPVAVTF